MPENKNPAPAETQQVSARQNRFNASALTVNGRFTTADARIKLERLHPSIEYR